MSLLLTSFPVSGPVPAEKYIVQFEHQNLNKYHLLQYMMPPSDIIPSKMHDHILTDFPLDILGQQSRINRVYTQITFCFPLVGDGSYLQSDTVNTVENGFQRLSENFPWIAGKIANDNGTFKIKPTDSPPRVVIKDYTKDPSVPNWNTLLQANCPFIMLDGSILAPCKTPETSSKGLLVFLVQANFVSGGGLLLTLNGQHGAIDMAGLAQVIYLFSKACRDHTFTEDELSIGNIDTRNLIPLVDDNANDISRNHNGPLAGDEKPRKVQLTEQKTASTNCKWAYFSFRNTSLEILKSQATITIPTGTSEIISTDVALSAFIWQSISRIRLESFTQLNQSTSNLETTLSRNVDVRRHLGIPASYPGLVTDTTVHPFPLEEVAKQSLRFLSSELRSALDPAALSRHTREIATRISREKKPKKCNKCSESLSGIRGSIEFLGQRKVL
jgi:hypothetical protein